MAETDTLADVARMLGEARKKLEDLLKPTTKAEPEPVFVVFDGPPSHESGRFVEVETADGKGVGVGEWKKREDGLWTLGPFYVTTREDK